MKYPVDFFFTPLNVRFACGQLGQPFFQKAVELNPNHSAQMMNSGFPPPLASLPSDLEGLIQSLERFGMTPGGAVNRRRTGR